MTVNANKSAAAARDVAYGTHIEKTPRPAARFNTALAVVGLLALSSGVHAQTPRVTITEGEMAGKPLANGGTLFAGIPFAAPPVGELRWKKPQPPAKWQGVRDATQWGPSCPQIDMGWNRLDAQRMSEDCLNLNVWVPAGKAKRLPVMVWIHGGGFIGGSGSSPTYDGETLIDHGVILVTINYRLGALGFLAHPDLSAESKDHVSGNYAVADQMAALGWVRRNIARFGGDPNNITVFGQSAGSISTANLITIPAARSNFKRAILESGTAFGVGDLLDLAAAEEDGKAFGNLAELRSMPVDALLGKWAGFAAASPYKRRSLPVVDGQIIRQQPMTAWLDGAARSMSILLGSNVVEMPAANRAAMVETAASVLGAEADRIIAWYEARGTDERTGDPATQLMTDMLFRCGTIVTAGAARRAWLYHFFEDFPGRGAPAHSAEVFYVFGTVATGSDGKPARPDGEQEKLASQMRQYWTNFAKRGDPADADLSPWHAYSKTHGDYLQLAAPSATAAKHLRAEPCRLLADVWTKSRGKRTP